MSIKATYICDLCKQEQPPHDLLAALWINATRGIKLYTSLPQSDTHVCMACVEAIRKDPVGTQRP